MRTRVRTQGSARAPIRNPIPQIAHFCLFAFCQCPTHQTAEWRSGSRVGLITQRSADRNLAPLSSSVHGLHRALPKPALARYLCMRRGAGIQPLCVSTPRKLKSRLSMLCYLQVFMVTTAFCLSRRLLGIHSCAGEEEFNSCVSPHPVS